MSSKRKASTSSRARFQAVTAPLGDQPVTQLGPQVGDMGLEGAPGPGGGLLPPHLLHQGVGHHRPPRLGNEHGEHGAWSRTPKTDRLIPHRGPDRA